jgi:catalase
VREVFDDDQRDRLVEQVSGSLLGGVHGDVLDRAFEYWTSIDPGVGKRIEDAVRHGTVPEPVPGMGES